MQSDEIEDEEKRIDKMRVKVVSIEQDLIIDLLNWWRDPPHWFALPITDELPEDCEVVSISVSWDRRCIEALVWSKSFPPCEHGSMPERIPGLMADFRQVEFTKDRGMIHARNS